MIKSRMEDLTPYPDGDDGQYAYEERPALPDGAARHCNVCFYTLAPGKSNFPYHYHLDQEEVFYILQGEGVVKTPEGDKAVRAGDLLFFPAGEAGAHKLTNTSTAEPLVYIDIDTVGQMDVAVYPDSGKVGVWSPTLNGTFRLKDKASYYVGE